MLELKSTARPQVRACICYYCLCKRPHRGNSSLLSTSSRKPDAKRPTIPSSHNLSTVTDSFGDCPDSSLPTSLSPDPFASPEVVGMSSAGVGSRTTHVPTLVLSTSQEDFMAANHLPAGRTHSPPPPHPCIS